MKSLYSFLLENIINEGGAAGHMAHPIDYIEFTANDLKQLISDLFLGKIEDITEKIDGTNIQATMNHDGEVVFIRNNGDLNSDKGGMSIEDMAVKWADKPNVAQTFIKAGEIIKIVFDKIGKKFFNPDPGTRRIVNCECVKEGITNIIPYASSQVAFHDIWIYKLDNGKWVKNDITKAGLDKLEKACENIDNAKPTPKVIINLVDDANDLIDKYHKMIDDLFDNDMDISINDWKYKKFEQLLNSKWSWIKENPQGMTILFDRWFNCNKKVNIRELKKMYVDHVDEINTIEKSSLYKEVTDEITEPLETIFLKLGNDIIKLCKGLLNDAKNDKVVNQLQKDMQDVIKDVQSNGSPETQAKLIKQLKRLERLGGDSSINPAEGIVFKYKDKLMKLTGSFAPINQVLGSIKFAK